MRGYRRTIELGRDGSWRSSHTLLPADSVTIVVRASNPVALMFCFWLHDRSRQAAQRAEPLPRLGSQDELMRPVAIRIRDLVAALDDQASVCEEF